MSGRLHDLAVLGGGPAGSTLATLMSEAGFDVVLVDKEKFPRDKVCGEVLSYDALPLLQRTGGAAGLERAGAAAITSCRIITPSAIHQFALPRPALGISRMKLDELLLRRAGAAGCEIREETAATGIRRTAEGYAVEIVAQDGSQQSLSARMVAGSWGRWGRIDRQLARPFVADQTRRHFGFKRHYRPNASGPPGQSIDLYSYNRGYLGVSAIEGGLVNICGLVHRSRLQGLRGGWEQFVATLAGEERPIGELLAAHQPAQDHFLSSEPVIFRARSCVEEGVFMIGDAAGLIDPLAGNGMAMAVQSAFLAASQLARALRGAASESEAGRTYAARYAGTFERRIRWSRLAALFLSRPRALRSGLALTGPLPAGAFFLRKTRAESQVVDEMIASWERTVRNL